MRKRILVLLGFSCLLLAACGRKQMDEKTAGEQMQAELQKRYQKDMEVSDVQMDDVGQNFSHILYLGTATCNEGIFEVRLDEGIVTDNYASLLYGKDIEEDTLRLMMNTNYDVSDVHFRYPFTDKRYSSHDDYMKAQNVTVYADMEVNGETFEVTAEKLHQVFQDLYDYGCHYNIKVKSNGLDTYFVYGDNSDGVHSKDIILQKLEGR